MKEELDIYNRSLIEIEKISSEIEEELDYQFDFKQVEDSQSSLDKTDYCCVLIFGMLGAMLSTNGNLRKYFASIHNSASKVSGEYDGFQKLMGKMFEHHGDDMDDNIKKIGPAFHRLLYGHDIFSTSNDNPFLLMINQKNSKLLGSIQAIRHLIADTMSRQGLPIPGSSWLNYTDENGKKTNYIIDLVNNLSKDSKQNPASIYRSLFTIKATDILGGTIDKILTESYFKIRKINDNIRKSQILFMVYSINFFAESIIGAAKHKGVPYINIPVGAMMMTSFAKFCYFNCSENFKITKRTDELLNSSDCLIKKYEEQQKYFNSFNSYQEIIDELEHIDNNMDLLIDFLEEDKNE